MASLARSSWNADGMRRMHAAIRRGLPGAREAGVRVIGSAVLRRAVSDAKLQAFDTGRYAGGYARAFNMIATTPMPVPALKESKLVPKARKMLEARLTRLESAERRIDHWITRDKAKPGHERWKSFRENTRKLKRVRELILFSQEQLRNVQAPEGAFAAVVFGRRTQTSYRKSSSVRVLRQLYGADAVVLSSGQTTMLRITHREPHARIVERRTRIMARAIGAARTLGAARVKPATLRAIEQTLIVEGLPGRVRRSG